MIALFNSIMTEARAAYQLQLQPNLKIDGKRKSIRTCVKQYIVEPDQKLMSSN